MCPGNNESAGKHKSGRTRKGNADVRDILTECAWSAGKTRSYIGAQFHRLHRRFGKKGGGKAAIAAAHTLIVIIWHVLRNQKPYRELGHAAADAAGEDFSLGTAGGGYGTTTANLKGGLGSASAMTASGLRVGALVVVNAIASAVMGSGPHFWAAPYEEGEEFGGLGLPQLTPDMRRLIWKGQTRAPTDGMPGTTIALIATDATLTKGQTKRLAVAAAGGLHKALRFAAAATDGDTVFAAAMGRVSRTVEVQEMNELGAVAGDCLARAIARGVYEATALPFPDAVPAWRDLFGR